MNTLTIQRGARVEAEDGDVGPVTHVIVDPATREVTHLVVAYDGREWLVPMSAVTAVERDRIRLQGERSLIYARRTFNRDEFQPIDDDQAREEGAGYALHGDAERRDEGPHRLQLKEERLRVEKTEEQAGIVRVSTRVTERIETVSVPVREERVIIEVVPGSGAVRIGDRELLEGETLEIPLREERLVVAKEVVVAEDVIVRKEVVERTEQVEETLRREELVVDEEGNLVVDEAEAAAETTSKRPRRDTATARER